MSIVAILVISIVSGFIGRQVYDTIFYWVKKWANGKSVKKETCGNCGDELENGVSKSAVIIDGRLRLGENTTCWNCGKTEV